MIKDNDILYAFSEILNKKYSNYELFIKSNEEEVKKPTFFLNIKHLTSDTYLRWNEKLINVRIIYTNANAEEEELQEIQNQLDEYLEMYITVGDTNLMFKNKKFDINNGFLTMTITINYHDSKTNTFPPERYTDKMKVLDYR